MACFEHKENFLYFKMKSDFANVFLKDLLSEKSHADHLVVIKIISIISQFTEICFSINKEVNDCNMLHEFLICQRVVYDVLEASMW